MNCFTPSSFANEENRPITFSIPVYQRLFVWSITEIYRLLDDLWEAFSKLPSQRYYIGNITIHREVGNTDIWEIVDGQQRLTFLSLFALKVKKWVEITNAEKYKVTSSSWTSFLCGGESGKMRLHFAARPDDRDDLLMVDQHQKKYFQTFDLTFDNFIEEKKEEIQDRINDFFKYVYDSITFLVAKMPESYTPMELNLYFEKMNSAGRQLEQEEILKGRRYFAPKADEWNRLVDFSYTEDGVKTGGSGTGEECSLLDILLPDSAGNSLWKNCEKPNISDRRDNRGVISIPVFLLHVLWLVCKDKGESLNGQSKFSKKTQCLLKTFDGCFKKDWVEDFMSKMRSYRQWMDENIIHRQQDGYFCPPSGYQVSSTEEDGIDYTEEENMQGKMTTEELQFQSMLVVSSDDFQQWILDAYCKSPKCSERFALLRKQDAERHSFPETIHYGDRGVLYWFQKLEYLLWLGNKKKDKTNFDFGEFAHVVEGYHFSNNGSEEHLYPQNPDESFSKIPEWENNDNDDERNKFGNLALISDSFNSYQGHAGIDEKRGAVFDRIKRGGRLESLKYLLMLLIAEKNNWIPSVAKEHREKMMAILREDWQKWQKEKSEDSCIE